MGTFQIASTLTLTRIHHNQPWHWRPDFESGNWKFEPQGKMKIAVLCVVMVLVVVIKAAPMKEDQEMDIEGDELQEMNIEARVEAEAFGRLLDTLDAMAKREPNPNPRGCPNCHRRRRKTWG